MYNSTLSDNFIIPIERITGTVENAIKNYNITLPGSSEETTKSMPSMIASVVPGALFLAAVVICITICISKWVAVPGEEKYNTDLERQQPGFTHGASGSVAVGDISFPGNIYIRRQDTLRRIDTGDSELPRYTASVGSRECAVSMNPPAYDADLPGYSTETSL